MLCRFCGHTMGQKVLHGQTLDICAACGGVWIDKEEFGKLFLAPQSPLSESQLAELKKELEWSASYDGAPQRLCPKCSEGMQRHLFAALSGISLDYCSADGIWCDPGELERLNDFLTKGGLQLARLNRWEEAMPVGSNAKADKPLPRVLRLLYRAAGLFR